MHSGEFDQKTQIFYATLRGAVTVDELAESLRTALSQEFSGPLRVLWRISEMQIDFAMTEANQLVEFVQNRESAIPEGKMAFVTGDGFIKSVVQTVRASGGEFRTEWETFDSEDAALAWLDSARLAR